MRLSDTVLTLGSLVRQGKTVAGSRNILILYDLTGRKNNIIRHSIILEGQIFF